MDSGALAGAEAAHHLATVLRSKWQKFWQRDPATVIAELHADLTKTLTVFGLNTQAGTAVNALLDAIADERFTNRAPVELPAYWSFTNGAFSFDPPAPEVVEETPEP
jgi:hypothetical protein